MYILKSKGILVKADYNQLTTHLKDWRKEHKIGWDQIAEGSGRGIINDFSAYQSPDAFVNSHVEFLKNGGAYYRKYLDTEWRWHGQQHYIEIWVEKHAIVGTVAAIVGNRFVSVGYNKGYPKQYVGKIIQSQSGANSRINGTGKPNTHPNASIHFLPHLSDILPLV